MYCKNFSAFMVRGVTGLVVAGCIFRYLTKFLLIVFLLLSLSLCVDSCHCCFFFLAVGMGSTLRWVYLPLLSLLFLPEGIESLAGVPCS